MKLVIVGGVAAGASAAARARRLAEDAEIVLFERGPEVSFANCGLPYYVGGVIGERAKLLVTTPERLRTRYRIDVRTRHSVESIDRANKKVFVRALDADEVLEVAYDKLILAPGAAPLRPPIPGVDLPGVFTLRNLQDADRIYAAIGGASHGVVVGGGFIGLEMVENLVHRGLATTLVELNQQLLPPLDPEMTAPIRQALKAHGVQVLLGDSAEAIEPAGSDLIVSLKSGQQLRTQLVVLGVGVRPDTKLASEAGLELGPRGGLRVDEHLRTNDPHIYAAGDAIEVTDWVTREATQVPLAGPANRQGRIAADNACGRLSRYRGTQATAIVGAFGVTVAMTGASEKTLRRRQQPFRTVYVHPAHHAGYYPGAEGMSLKLLFESQSGKILGAQGVGGAGVDKRIDVLAMAVQAGLTVFDLEEAELCYAPQFGAAKDPVNMAGFVAAGLLRGDHPQIEVRTLLALPEKERPLVVDVRTPEEYAEGHLPGAINIPVDVLRERRGELPAKRALAVYCQVGMRGYLATRMLLARGHEVVNISGGYRSYQMAFPPS